MDRQRLDKMYETPVAVVSIGEVRELIDYIRELEAKQTMPFLGLATTRELLGELQARAEVGGYATYRTVDGH